MTLGPVDELVPILKKLRLSGVLQTLEMRLQQALEGELSHAELILRLLTDEVERRDGKQIQLRVSRAGFEHHKTLEDFDFAFNPKLPKAKILDLCSCHFLTSHANVVIVGPSGVGKSHVAHAIGQRACMLGEPTLYVSAQRLFTSLRAARADGTYDRQLARLIAPALLIVDDLGLRPLTHDEPMDLYEVIRQRYEKSSTIITSNRDVPEWYALFGDPLLASAAMDRLLHHAEVLTLEGRSFRTHRRSHSPGPNASTHPAPNP
jgi:DNA replication protein DnaC